MSGERDAAKDTGGAGATGAGGAAAGCSDGGGGFAAAGDAPAVAHPARSGAAFPWATLTAFGLGVLRWPPDAFWSATPAELLAAAGALAPPAAKAAPTRAELAALMARFPDGADRKAGAAAGQARRGSGRDASGGGDDSGGRDASGGGDDSRGGAG